MTWIKGWVGGTSQKVFNHLVLRHIGFVIGVRINNWLCICCVLRAAEAEVQIRITDKNDNAPYFKRSVYSAQVAENMEEGSIIITVTAEDRDEGGKGGRGGREGEGQGGGIHYHHRHGGGQGRRWVGERGWEGRGVGGRMEGFINITIVAEAGMMVVEEARREGRARVQPELQPKPGCHTNFHKEITHAPSCCES